MVIASSSERAGRIYNSILKIVSTDLIDDKDNIIIVGGDGFLLRAVSRFGIDKTYIPVNGGTLGYLLNDIADSNGIIFSSAIEKLATQSWDIKRFPILSAEFDNGVVDFSVNDVYAERASGQTARISIEIDGVSLVKKMVADGVIISSALGSTGYNFSAGGPIVHPLSKSIIITPSNPHSHGFRSMVLAPTTKVKVIAEDTKYRPVRFVTDGREQSNVESACITMGAKELKLGYFEDHNFTNKLVSKLLTRN